MVTMPSEKDLRNPEIGKVVEKYFRGVASIPTEHRMRILRLIENLTLGTAAVGYLTESMHGAGSPQAQQHHDRAPGQSRAEKRTGQGDCRHSCRENNAAWMNWQKAIESQGKAGAPGAWRRP